MSDELLHVEASAEEAIQKVIATGATRRDAKFRIDIATAFGGWIRIGDEMVYVKAAEVQRGGST